MINLHVRQCNINCRPKWPNLRESCDGTVFIDVWRGHPYGMTGALTMYNRAEMGSAYLSRLGLPMPTLDERVAYLEGRLEEHSSRVDGLRQDIRELRDRFESRMDRLESRMDRLESRMDRLDSRMDGFDGKLSRQFTWLVGIQIVMFIAMMTAIGSR